MFFKRKLISTYKVIFSVALFLILFSIIQWIWKPAIMYDTIGNIRPFGVGFRHKTVFPVWFVVIVLALFCYIFVSFYSQPPLYKK